MVVGRGIDEIDQIRRELSVRGGGVAISAALGAQAGEAALPGERVEIGDFEVFLEAASGPAAQTVPDQGEITPL